MFRIDPITAETDKGTRADAASIGRRDFRVPLNNTLEHWSVLRRQQIEGRLLIFPEENHWIRQEQPVVIRRRALVAARLPN